MVFKKKVVLVVDFVHEGFRLICDIGLPVGGMKQWMLKQWVDIMETHSFACLVQFREAQRV